MGRRTKVLGFSLPPELQMRVDQLAKGKHKTRSEFLREMIEAYFASTSSLADSTVGETDLARVLQSYWQLKAGTELEIVVAGLGIIRNQKGQILIGARSTPDEIVENLTWSFPGGQLESLDFAKELQKLIKVRAGLNVEIENLVSARVFPDSTVKNVQIVALYFSGIVTDAKTTQRDEAFKQLRWVKPLEVFKFFTTSTSDDVTKYLSSLHYS